MSLAKHVSIFFKADTKGFQSGLDNMSKRLKKFSRQTQKLGRSITRNISVPFALAGAAAVKMVSEFDTSMTKINTLVGVSEGQIKKFKEQVLELSGKVAQSPKDLADGLFFLTSAGLKGANAMETLESVSKGVAIGLGEQTDLAKVAGAAQNAYGKDVLSASESLDIFGKMVKTGMFESSELAGVLGKEAGFAAALGISFEELGAFISTYTRTTGDATSATVGVSGVMMAFTKQTDKGEKALGRINTTYGEVKQMLGEQGLQKTLIHLKQRFAEENVEMSEFFSKSQSLKGVINVLGNQTGEYVNILGELKDSTGFVNDGFEVVAETTGFKMKKAFNDLKLAMMEFGVVLIPIAETLAGAISKIAEKFKGLDSSTKETFGYIAVALAAAGPILLGVSLLSSGIASATKAVGLLRGAFVALAANPALIAVGIAMAVAMQQINETTEAIDEQGKTVTKLTEGAKGWMKIWGIVKWMIGKVGEQLGITAQVIGKIAESMNHMVNLRFGKAGDSLKEAFDTVKKTEFLAFGKWGKEIEGVLADVEEQIGLKDYELNKPKADPKSAEELQEEIQKQLDLLSPLIVPLDTGGGGGGGGGEDDGVKIKKTDVEEIKDMYPFLDEEAIKNSLGQIQAVFSEGGSKIVEQWGMTMEELNQMQLDLAESFSSGLGNAFADAVIEGKNFGEAMLDVFKQMLRQLIATVVQALILQAILKAFPGVEAALTIGAKVASVIPTNDVAFGPSAGRFITGPEGTFSLNPNDSIVAGTNLFGSNQGNNNMKVNGYIDGSSIFLSNTRQTNTINRLS